jgi:hypothetical protein
MLLQKWSRFVVLQKLVYSRRGLHEREELEVTQTDVDAAEFAYLDELPTKPTGSPPRS